jgi:hypothetical protein
LPIPNSPARIAAGLALAALVPAAPAQVAPLQQQSLALPYDSGWLANPAPAEQVLASTTVRVQGASWLRLRFQLVSLWNDGDESTGARLRVTSHADGAVQELHALHARQWQSTSAYFNGDALQVDLVAPPGAGRSRLILRGLWAGPPSSPQFSQCGPTDDRVLSSDPRVARVLPLSCTGWLFDDCNHCFVTAGHCLGNSYLDVAQFNVPLSLPSGSVQHPPPEDQYVVDDTSQQGSGSGVPVGEDWGSFGCFANSNTGLMPFQRQGGWFTIAAPPSFSPAEVLRVTGYGLDQTPWDHSQVQQTDAGPYFSYAGTTVRYEADTYGGNSGSPVIWDGGGGVAIGVHTHGGCNPSPPYNGNYGTASTHAGWTAGRASPLGVCVPNPSTNAYCTAKVNSLGCTPTLGASGSPSASGGAGSFAVVAGNLLNQKAGLVFYGYLPLAGPFQGGFKCVAAPTVRTPLQGTGGASSGSSCTGSLAYDMGARIASGVDPQLVCGAIVYVQCWSRDPADPFTTSLTGGLRFAIGP